MKTGSTKKLVKNNLDNFGSFKMTKINYTNLARLLKKDFDEDCDIVIDCLISNEDEVELVITRTGDDDDQYYRIQVDKHVVGSDDYELLIEAGSDLDDFISAIEVYVKNGGDIKKLK